MPRSSVVIIGVFIQHHIDNKEGAKHQGLFPDVHVHGECDSEVVRVCEHVFNGAAPSLGNRTHFSAVLLINHGEFDVTGASTATLVGAAATVDLGNQILVLVEDAKRRVAAVKQVGHVSQHLAGRRLHRCVVVATRAGAARRARTPPEVPLYPQHLLLHIVGDVVDESSL